MTLRVISSLVGRTSLLWGMVTLAACGGSRDEARAREPAPSSPGHPPSPSSPRGCPSWSRGGSEDAPSSATLRALLGEPLEGEAIRRLIATYGPPERVSSPDDVALELRRGGFALDFHRGRLERVRLNGRLLGASHFAGAMSDGIELGAGRTVVERALGTPDDACEKSASGECRYAARGLSVRYDDTEDHCVAWVHLVPAVAPGRVRFTSVDVRPYRDADGTSGLAVVYRWQAAPMPDLDGVDVFLQLHDDAGRIVASPPREASPPLPADTTVRVGATRGAWSGQERVFVPARSLRLAAGKHQVKARLLALGLRAGTGAAKSDSSGQSAPEYAPLPLEGDAAIDLDLDMPEVHRFRIGVRHVEVKPKAYDGENAAGMGRPDLFWRVMTYDATTVYPGYRSSVRDDTFTASWTEMSPWLRLASDESLTICVSDLDVLSSEELACFPIDLRRIADPTYIKQTFSRGDVIGLRLAVERAHDRDQ